MPVYSADTLIKILRKERGLTQTQLSEGICTKDTLSRIERGERLPDWFTFRLLMERLGETPERYYKSIVTKNDRVVLGYEDEVQRLLSGYDRPGLQRLVEEMEKNPVFADKKSGYMQYLYRWKAMSIIENGRDLNEARQLILNSLKIMRPNFDEEKIDTYCLSDYEIGAINSLAIVYDKLQGIEKTTEIFEKLKESFERNYRHDVWTNKMYRVLLANIARNYRYMGKYEDSISLCDLGLSKVILYEDMSLYPKFLVHKAFCMLKLGHKDKGDKLFRRVCYYYLSAGLEHFLPSALEYYETETGEKMVLADRDNI